VELKLNGGRQQNSKAITDTTSKQQGHQAESEKCAEGKKYRVWAFGNSAPRGMRNNSKQRRAYRTMETWKADTNSVVADNDSKSF